jgi:vitamin K-dependent gamma-carboxylase
VPQATTTRTRLLEHLNKPTPADALVIFRVIFGLLVTVGALRFLWNGWVDSFFVKPTFFFTFDFAPWVEVGPPWLMLGLVVALAVLGLCVALGLFYRCSTVLLLLVFSYLELTDVTNYLNHYYQVSILALLLCFMPLHRRGSLDVRRKPAIAVEAFPAWMTFLLRFQVGIVYVFAALAKLNSDWLLHAQPLNIWLLARTDVPILGSFLGSYDMALAMSWGGFLNDLLIVPALLYRPTRKWAYGLVVVFHILTGYLFNIGMFPLIMIGTATIFFDSDWPSRLFRRWRNPPPGHPPATERSKSTHPMVLGKVGLVLLVGWCSLHLAVPLRTYAYVGPTNWHEQGMRFSWRVMVREKNGSVMYKVKTRERRRPRLVSPSKYLTAAQEREMSGQPDLILQLAHHIAADFESQGYRDVEVRADAIVSWNGRLLARLIDPDVDLAKETISFFESAHWILPAPNTPPIRLEPRAIGGKRGNP